MSQHRPTFPPHPNAPIVMNPSPFLWSRRAVAIRYMLNLITCRTPCFSFPPALSSHLIRIVAFYPGLELILLHRTITSGSCLQDEFRALTCARATTSWLMLCTRM